MICLLYLGYNLPLHATQQKQEQEYTKQTEKKNKKSTLNGRHMNKGFSIGLLGVYNGSEYKGSGNEMKVVPGFKYMGKHIYFKGIKAGAYIYKSKGITISADLSVKLNSNDPNKQEIFQGMEKRSKSILFGPSFTQRIKRYSFTVSTKYDLNGNAGNISQARINRAFMPSKKIFIIPSIGLIYFSDRYLNYYYGVTRNEITSNRPQYQVKNGCIDYSISLTTIIKIAKKLSNITTISNRYLSDKIYNSSLVDTKYSLKIMAGLMFRF